MPPRPLSFRVLLAAATLAFVPAAEGARAQDVDLRDVGTGSGSGSPAVSLRGVGGFPSSPNEAPLSAPDDVSPPPSVDPVPAGGDQSHTAQPSQPDPDDGAPNYGKPRKRKPKLYRPPAKMARPLSPLVPYRGAPGERRVLNPAPPQQDAGDPTSPAPTIAVLPSPLQQRRPPIDPDPYAPTGVRLGQMILKPFVEGSTGYESNPNQVSTGIKPSAVLRTDGGLDAISDFSSGSLTANLRGGYSDYPSNSNANRPDVSAIVDGRADVTRQDTIDTEARFVLATQTPGSPLLAVPNAAFTTNRPSITSEGATLGGTHLFGRLSVGLKGTFDRTQYGDATESDGSIFRYSEDNYNDYGVVAKAAYEASSALIPFAEFGFDSRVRDNPMDLSGYERDSVGGTARAGATVDLFGHLTGSASAGYLERHYVDPRLPNLRGPTVDSALTYAATPLTTVTLRASTTASETTLPGASGAISRSFTAEIAHVLFRNFTVTGLATVQPTEYQGVPGHETYTTLTLKGAYNVSRDVQLIASASHQMLKSTFVGESFRDDVFLAGVRLQR